MYEYWLFPEATAHSSLDRPISTANYPSAIAAVLDMDTYAVDGSLANIETYKVLGVVTYTDNVGDTHTVLTDFSAPFNQPAAGDPTITGTVRVGDTLMADVTGVTDGNGRGTLTYQWRVATDDQGTSGADAEGTGADSASYTPAAGDEGNHLKVVVTFTDDDGYEESRESEWTAAVAAPLPMVSVAPKAGGESVIGGNPAVFTLTRTANDVTATLEVTISITGDFPTTYTPVTTATFAADAEMVDVEVPTNTLAAGATNQMVTLAIQDSAGDTYQVDSTSGGNTATVTVMPQANRSATGEPTITPTIAGPAAVGQMLMATRQPVDDLDGLPTADSDFTYQWHRVDADGTSNSVDIGTNSATYTLVAADVSSRIRVTVSFTDRRGTDEMRTSEAYPSSGTVQAAAQPGNTPASGMLTISGTLTVGAAVSAVTTAIDDADGLGTFSYQWRRADDASGTNEADIAGATSAAYTLVTADEGKHLQVVVSFTDGGGTDESVESTWTANAVVDPPRFTIAAPAAAVAEPTPGGTDTSLVFTVSLSAADDATVTFSIGGSAMSGADFTVQPSNGMLAFTGGATTQSITVSILGDILSEPNETVTVTLTGASAGSVVGEMNTATGTITERQGQIEVSAAVSPNLEYDAASGMTRVNFTVSLDGQAPSNGAVEWRAVLGDEAQVVTGTVNFATGERGKSASASFRGELPPGGMIEIQLRPFAAQGRSVASAVEADGSVEAGSETVEVSSQVWVRADQQQIPSSRTASDFAATSMLTAFGRMASTRLVEMVWIRAEAHRTGTAPSHASLGGRSIDTSAYAPSSSASQAAGETARLFGIELADPALASIDGPDRAPVAEGSLEDFANWTGLPGGDGIPGGTSFALSHGDGERGSTVYWGEVNFSSAGSDLEDDEFSALSTEGDITNYSLGLDYRLNESVLLGLAVSRSSGEAEYSFADSNDGSGNLSASITTASPWLRWKAPSGMEIWGTVGIGSGTADGVLDGSSAEMDISMRTIAAGTWNHITAINGTNVAARADLFTAAVSSEGASAVVDDSDAGSRRIRLAAELSSERAALAGMPAPYAIEVGARHDSGDAESGVGIDVAGSFSYGNPSSSFSISGRGSIVLYHGQEGFSETGLGLSVDYDSGADAHGLLFSLEPTWNAPRSNVDDLMWDTDSINGPDPSSGAGAAVRTRLGYGMSALENFALAKLYGEMQNEEDGNRMRLGSEFGEIGQRVGSLRFDFYGELLDGDSGAEQAVMLEGGLEF